MNDSVFAHLAALSPSENTRRGMGATTGRDGAVGAAVSTFCRVVSVMASTFGDARRQQRGEIRWNRAIGRRALRRTPNRIRKMRVVRETGNDDCRGLPG